MCKLSRGKTRRCVISRASFFGVPQLCKPRQNIFINSDRKRDQICLYVYCVKITPFQKTLKEVAMATILSKIADRDKVAGFPPPPPSGGKKASVL
jgi:hypothetical protein